MPMSSYRTNRALSISRPGCPTARKSLFEVTAVTVAELWHGVERAVGAHRADASSISEPFWLNSPSFLTRKKTAYEHARIWAELEASGKMIGYYDLIVAATALQRGSAVVSLQQTAFFAGEGADRR